LLPLQQARPNQHERTNPMKNFQSALIKHFPKKSAFVIAILTASFVTAAPANAAWYNNITVNNNQVSKSTWWGLRPFIGVNTKVTWANGQAAVHGYINCIPALGNSPLYTRATPSVNYVSDNTAWCDSADGATPAYLALDWSTN
jgi:hypothetical protein